MVEAKLENEPRTERSWTEILQPWNRDLTFLVVQDLPMQGSSSITIKKFDTVPLLEIIVTCLYNAVEKFGSRKNCYGPSSDSY